MTWRGIRVSGPSVVRPGQVRPSALDLLVALTMGAHEVEFNRAPYPAGHCSGTNLKLSHARIRGPTPGNDKAFWRG